MDKHTLTTLVALAAFISGCATIINGTTQKVPVSSDPSGVTVTIENGTKYTTPAVIEFSRKENHTIQFSRDGYQPETVQLESVTSGAAMGNLLAGGLIGWGVDAASGGQYRLVPESVHVSLRPAPYNEAREAKAPVPESPTLEDRLQQLKNLREKNLINDEEYQASRKATLQSTFGSATTATTTIEKPPVNIEQTVSRVSGGE